MMSLSMPSYFLGVGTVVGALALGFGGGIVLTKSAIKDSAGPSRMERAARSEPAAAAPQVTEARAVPVPRADQAGAAASAIEPVRQIEVSPVQAAAEQQPAADPKPVAEVARPAASTIAEPVRQIDTSKQAEQPVRPADAPKQVEQPVRQAEAPKQMEQPARQTEARQVEQRESEQRSAEREQRRAEQRRIEREKRNVERERKARSVIIVRRQRPLEEEEREQPIRRELAFEREEPRPNLFEGLFGRPSGESRE